MAEALLRQKLSANKSDIVVESAGIGALVGKPADPIAVELMAERGIDLGAHRARQLTADLAREFELILTMEQGHVGAVEQIAPAARGKVFRLGKWSNFEIPDPYRLPRAEFERALELIDRGVDDVVRRIGGAR